jgi:stage V sporulation protein B
VKDAKFDVSTASGGATFLIGWLTRSAVMLLLLVILARLLGPDDFGLYTIVIALFYLLEMIGYLGVDAAIRKRLPETKGTQQKRVIINSGFISSGSVAIALAVVMLFLSGFIANSIYGNGTLELPIEAAAAAVIFSAIFNAASASLLGLRKNAEAAKANVAFAFGCLVAAPLFVLQGYGVLGAVLGLAVGNAVAAIISLVYLNRSVVLNAYFPKTSEIKELIVFSLPIFVSNLAATFATSFGVLLLGVYASSFVVGNYGIAFKFGSFIIIVLNAINSVLLPSFSYALTRKSLAKRMSEIYAGSIYYTLIFLLPALAYLISVSVPIMGLLFSYRYSLAPIYFVLISLGMTARIVGSYAGSLVIGYGNPRRFMHYQLFVVSSEILLTLFLVPALGISGLFAAMYLISPLILDLVYIRAMQRQFSVKPTFAMLPRLVFASIIVFLPMFIVSNALGQSTCAVLINAVVLLLIYPPVLVALKAVDAKSIYFLESVGKNISLLRPLVNPVMAYLSLFIRKR